MKSFLSRTAPVILATTLSAFVIYNPSSLPARPLRHIQPIVENKPFVGEPMFVFQTLQQERKQKGGDQILTATQITASREDITLKIQSGQLTSTFLNLKTDGFSGPITVDGVQYSGISNVYYDLNAHNIYIKPVDSDYYIPAYKLNATVMDSSNKPVQLYATSQHLGLFYSLDGINDANPSGANGNDNFGNFLQLKASSNIFSINGHSVQNLYFSASDVQGGIPSGPTTPLPYRCYFLVAGYNAYLWNENADINFNSKPSGVKSIAPQPNPFQLMVKPNPAYASGPAPNISYTLPNETSVRLEVYNELGAKVSTVISDEREMAGQHQIRLDLANLPGGNYIVQLNTSENTATFKFSLAK